MHITLETDYAIRIVDCLARSGGKMDASAISSATDVPQRFSLKILRKLVHRGIVKSYKGAQGGYELVDEPQNITLRRVVEAVEGEYNFSRCLSKDYHCSHNVCGTENKPCACRFRTVYDKISVMVRNELDKVTFARNESEKEEN